MEQQQPSLQNKQTKQTQLQSNLELEYEIQTSNQSQAKLLKRILFDLIKDTNYECHKYGKMIKIFQIKSQQFSENSTKIKIDNFISYLQSQKNYSQLYQKQQQQQPPSKVVIIGNNNYVENNNCVGNSNLTESLQNNRAQLFPKQFLQSMQNSMQQEVQSEMIDSKTKIEFEPEMEINIWFQTARMEISKNPAYFQEICKKKLNNELSGPECFFFIQKWKDLEKLYFQSMEAQQFLLQFTQKRHFQQNERTFDYDESQKQNLGQSTAKNQPIEKQMSLEEDSLKTLITSDNTYIYADFKQNKTVNDENNSNILNNLQTTDKARQLSLNDLNKLLNGENSKLDISFESNEKSNSKILADNPVITLVLGQKKFDCAQDQQKKISIEKILFNDHNTKNYEDSVQKDEIYGEKEIILQNQHRYSSPRHQQQNQINDTILNKLRNNKIIEQENFQGFYDSASTDSSQLRHQSQLNQKINMPVKVQKKQQNNSTSGAKKNKKKSQKGNSISDMPAQNYQLHKKQSQDHVNYAVEQLQNIIKIIKQQQYKKLSLTQEIIEEEIPKIYGQRIDTEKWNQFKIRYLDDFQNFPRKFSFKKDKQDEMIQKYQNLLEELTQKQ